MTHYSISKAIENNIHVIYLYAIKAFRFVRTHLFLPYKRCEVYFNNYKHRFFLYVFQQSTKLSFQTYNRNVTNNSTFTINDNSPVNKIDIL